MDELVFLKVILCRDIDKIYRNKMIANMIRGISLGIIVLFVFGMLGIKYQQSNLESNSLEEMITGSAQVTFLEGDPCANHVLGNPPTSEYIKIELVCGEKKTINSLDARVVSKRNLYENMRLLARVNKFQIEFGDDGLPIRMGNWVNDDKHEWNCYHDKNRINEGNYLLLNQARVLCKYEEV